MMGHLDKNDIMAGPLGQRPDSYVYARVRVNPLVVAAMETLA